MRAIKIKLGAKVEKLGRPGWRVSKASDPSVYLEAGCVGEVVEIQSPIMGTGIHIDDDDNGDPLYDEGRDGCAVVLWPTWGRALIWPDDEDRTWRRVK